MRGFDADKQTDEHFLFRIDPVGLSLTELS
mgnify:CR=1 FL=1